jgi:hypothetical protein
MSARPNIGRHGAATPRRWVGFPSWLAAQAHRSDDIGQLAQHFLASGEIDRTDLDPLHKAIAEWAANA